MCQEEEKGRNAGRDGLNIISSSSHSHHSSSHLSIFTSDPTATVCPTGDTATHVGVYEAFNPETFVPFLDTIISLLMVMTRAISSLTATDLGIEPVDKVDDLQVRVCVVGG